MDILKDNALFQRLCETTDPSEDFLTKLVLKGIITRAIVNKLQRLDDNLSKNAKIYEFLRTSGDDSDIPELLLALQESANKKPLALLKASLPAPKQTSSGPKGPVKVSTIASELLNDKDVVTRIETFYEKFPNVRFADMSARLSNYRVQNNGPYELLKSVLDIWVSKSAKKESTVGKLAELLLNEKIGDGPYKKFAETLLDKWDPSAQVEN